MSGSYIITGSTKAVSDTDKIYINFWMPICEMYSFRLLDDDGVVYFYGLSKTCDDEDAFLPLDEYGEAYGCTMIEYLNKENMEWEQL